MSQAWQVAVEVPAADAWTVADAIERFVITVSVFEIEGTPDWAVTGIIEGFPDHAAIVAAIEDVARAGGFTVSDIRIDLLPEIDWLARNRDSFPSLYYGRFLIHGSYRRPARPTNALTIEVDAGRAFGSGTHGSTEGCLRALDQLARSRRPRRILDLGCGSGILAIAAARLWRRAMIAATDIDIQAVETTRENVRLNRVARQIVSSRADGYPLRRPPPGGRCDLVIANILAQPLIGLAPDAGRWVRPGGHIILSGLLTHQEQAVLAAYRANGFALGRRHRVRGWSTLMLRRRLKRRSNTSQGILLGGGVRLPCAAR